MNEIMVKSLKEDFWLHRNCAHCSVLEFNQISLTKIVHSCTGKLTNEEATCCLSGEIIIYEQILKERISP